MQWNLVFHVSTATCLAGTIQSCYVRVLIVHRVHAWAGDGRGAAGVLARRRRRSDQPRASLHDQLKVASHRSLSLFLSLSLSLSL